MIDMHSKSDNMHKNVMFYALICINNHIIITCINCMLSDTQLKHKVIPSCIFSSSQPLHIYVSFKLYFSLNYSKSFASDYSYEITSYFKYMIDDIILL